MACGGRCGHALLMFARLSRGIASHAGVTAMAGALPVTGRPVDGDRLRVAARAGMSPLRVVALLDAAAQRQRTHGDVISLCIGAPDAREPQAVRAAAVAALHNPQACGYTEPLGLPVLREAIAGHYAHGYELPVDAREVAVTTGASSGLLLAFLACFDVGDRVALARPSYPGHRHILTALGAEVVELPGDAAGTGLPSVEMLEQIEPVQGLVVTTPANPTGSVLDGRELARLAAWCEHHGTQLVTDESYHPIAYDVALHTAWEFSRQAVVVGSFSQYWAMPGWRLGWVLAPPRLRAAVSWLAGNIAQCPPALAQHAAVAAFTAAAYAEAEANLARYRTNRDMLLGGLAALGITEVSAAQGGFYVYANISAHTADSLAWCRRLLADTGVVLAPGADFDELDGHRFVRISYAGTTEDIRRGLARLADWIR
jgi:aspartate/methionine/tyrosine aminotransferase